MDSEGGEKLDGAGCTVLAKFKKAMTVHLSSGEKLHLACIWEIKH